MHNHLHDKKKSSQLRKNALEPLPLGSIRPEGWLLNQLRIQAAGLSGHLDEFWPDVADSQWIGGNAEGWERGPYWLDGVVPLAFLLDDERLTGKVQRWINYILIHQHPDGWLGPVLDPTYGYAHDPWPVFVLLKALTQYQEATGDERVIPAMQRFFRELTTLLYEQPLKSWAKMRWADLVLSLSRLYERTGEDWLLGLAHKVHAQGYDWRTHFTSFVHKERQKEWTLEGHGVNHAMAMKAPGVWYRLSGDEGDRQAALHGIAILDQYHGQASGAFTCDECLAGKNPSQGTELCTVVECLFSLEVLLAILGEVSLADRLERIAFNALPATFTPDMWAHQYDQQANQVLCSVVEDRIYTTNGPDANIFGLAPTFGCCTANMHQGWPKFATHLWMRTPDNGLAATAYAPCTVTINVMDIPVQIMVSTAYPFEEKVQISVSAERPVRFPLYLRIPGWAYDATVTLEGQPVRPAEAGTFARIEREWTTGTSIHIHLPMPIRPQTRYHDSVAIERGPLIYALKVDEVWRQIGGELPHADWEIAPASSWNYALDIDPAHPEASFRVTYHEVGDCPFSSEGAPAQLHVKGRRVPIWVLEHNAAGPLPESPVTSAEPLEELTLIPYGCTTLRITELPVLRHEGSDTESTERTSSHSLPSNSIIPVGPADKFPDIVPNDVQCEWLALRFGMFIHFGINTYFDCEWSDGTLNPGGVDARNIDPEEWIATAKAAGMHYIILVAKHHDGFCNWPTATTNYSVAATPGQVDIVNRVADACLRLGVQLGLYYSLWDRHEPRYQDDAAYADFMARQLSELLTLYGSVCELWFDGGWDKWAGTWQETMKRWRWSEIYELVKSLQPSILVLNNTTTEEPGVIRWWPVDARTGEKALPAEKDSTIWSINGQLRYLPMQCEFTMSTSGEGQFSDGNWFWHSDDHSVAAPEVIVDHLRKANAHGANLVMNVGPMASGKLRPEDVAELLTVGHLLEG